jgi:hypothetical protein
MCQQKSRQGLLPPHPTCRICSFVICTITITHHLTYGNGLVWQDCSCVQERVFVPNFPTYPRQLQDEHSGVLLASDKARNQQYPTTITWHAAACGFSPNTLQIKGSGGGFAPHQCACGAEPYLCGWCFVAALQHQKTTHTLFSGIARRSVREPGSRTLPILGTPVEPFGGGCGAKAPQTPP